MKPETQEWVDMAEIDLAAAQALLERSILPPVVFHSHLAVEKMLKAHWVEQHIEGVPPRTHDLVELLDEIELDIPEWRNYLARLSEQAVASRYAKPDTYSRELVLEYVERSKQLCALLLQRLR